MGSRIGHLALGAGRSFHITFAVYRSKMMLSCGYRSVAVLLKYDRVPKIRKSIGTLLQAVDITKATAVSRQSSDNPNIIIGEGYWALLRSLSPCSVNFVL